MFSPKLWLVARVGAIAGLAGLLMFVLNTIAAVQANPALAGASAFLDATAYPAGSSTPGNESNPYPAVSPTENNGTEPGNSSGPTKTPQPTSTTEPAESLTPSVTPTITLTSTLPPDVFRTEDSEINGAKTTPLVTETPGPTATVYDTPTLTETPIPSETAQVVIPKKTGPNIDWGLFWIGFSLPVLGGCGVVLYLLDRRPDIFKRLH